MNVLLKAIIDLLENELIKHEGDLLNLAEHELKHLLDEIIHYLQTKFKGK